MDWLNFIAIGISVISLLISFYAIWKIYLSPFKLLISFGDPLLKTYKITPQVSGGKTIWYIPSIDIPITFLNIGARPGKVVDLRLTFSSLQKNINSSNQYEETFEPRWCVHYEDYNSKRQERFSWLRESVENDWYPFYVLQNTPMPKHIILESFRWDKFPRGSFQIRFEVLTDESSKWRLLEEYEFSLDDSEISGLKKGSGYSLPKKKIIEKPAITIERA